MHSFLAGLHRHLVTAVEDDKRPIANPLADRRFASVPNSFRQNPERLRRGAKRSSALEHISKGVPPFLA
jgi:hypothetical protein